MSLKGFRKFNFLFLSIWSLYITNCFHRTVANYWNYIINKEKVYVDNESLVIRLIKNARSHYGSRNSLPFWQLTLPLFASKHVCEYKILVEAGFSLIFVWKRGCRKYRRPPVSHDTKKKMAQKSFQLILGIKNYSLMPMEQESNIGV